MSIKTSKRGALSKTALPPEPAAIEAAQADPADLRKVAEFPPAADAEHAQALARLLTEPSAHAAVTLSGYIRFDEGDGKERRLHIGELMNVLIATTKGMVAGDMSRPEAMLYNQAVVLEGIFHKLAYRANQQDAMSNFETYLRMALKAQNQCRMTLETLSTIKNPPTVFARQANINNGGQQQVNNGVAAPKTDGVRARVSKAANRKTKLLEATDVQRLDEGEAKEAGGADSQLVPVEKINRPAQR